mmetsp:Transcript_19334/g.36399  ORF Transcript_19334/g.36399 Transcript_19334/m.36399 type:complete len:277 (-) Transcript_19334:314-1144(-)|eukprot:CAMPEP_0170171568 /NCGR_PEP_ID=MMETSP0040_2-20121228/4722_1 /TAXON_ID=641309 /ORGANISM="Lotharella oceanica, Strain CCMP622" /LENGTH=276 /DNA_ID=CAMNT_0010411695 /DNA_START=46 /DNA_END=876 /DNA_ORIENTATION=-
MCIGTSVPAHHKSIITAHVVDVTPACVLSAMPLVKKRQRRKRRERKNSKPKKPKRPKTAYNYFQLAEKQRLIGNSGRTSAHNGLFARNIGQRWKNLSAPERMQFQALADQDKKRYERDNLAYIRSIAVEAKTSNEEQAEQASVAGNKRPLLVPASGTKKLKLSPIIPDLIDYSPPSTPTLDNGGAPTPPPDLPAIERMKSWSDDDVLSSDFKDFGPQLLEASPPDPTHPKLEVKDFPTIPGMDEFGLTDIFRDGSEFPPNLFDAALDTSPLGTTLW